MMSGTITVSWGAYGGWYVTRHRVCLGWVAIGGYKTFARADSHVCSLGPRAGLSADGARA